MSRAASQDIFLSTYLAAYLDKRLLVFLLDGRIVTGLLRSFDHFSNVILEKACERVIVGDLYCDIPLGLYVIRGEHIVVIGELNLNNQELPRRMTRVDTSEIKTAQRTEKEATEIKRSMRKRMDFLDFDRLFNTMSVYINAMFSR